MNLSDYGRKRDFKKTPEPASGTSDKKNLPIFVVQKHDASHLHYDFRLEHKGVLLSWAIPKEISNDPSVKRLAAKVEDHPFDYRNFEGTIPEGNYGAGTVMVWDRGVYSILNKLKKNEIEKAVENKLKKNHISIFLYGDKLKGEYVLVKIKNNDWIFFKSKDEFSNTGSFDQKSVLSKRTMEEISQGFAEEELGPKVPMPRNIKPMMAQTAKEPFNRENWFFEIKWDGYRAIAEVENGAVNLYSRNFLSFNQRYPTIVEELKKISDTVILDGEIVALDKKGKSDFQALQYFNNKSDKALVYYIFDLLYYNGYDLMKLPLRLRKNILKKIFHKSQSCLKYSDHLETEGKEFFNVVKKQGIEGIVAKDGNSPYLAGTRSPKWLKIKKSNTIEAIIVGYTKKEQQKLISSLLLAAYNDKDELQFIGHVGTGFNEKKLINLQKIFNYLAQPKPPLRTIPKLNASTIWLKPVLVCTVSYREITREKILRQPVFLYLRDDMKPTEVRLEYEKV